MRSRVCQKCGFHERACRCNAKKVVIHYAEGEVKPDFTEKDYKDMTKSLDEMAVNIIDDVDFYKTKSRFFSGTRVKMRRQFHKALLHVLKKIT
ncbi:MAG: hypothetical protein ACI86H_002735 [bacterium]|jgi:hypothetical protein